MKIEDDLLDQKEFEYLQDLIMGRDIAWYYQDGIDFENVETENEFMLTHIFYFRSVPCSSHFNDIETIFLEKIDPISLWRIKANLLTKTSNIVENSFHTDLMAISEEKLKQWTTSIFYVNTNNGYSKFEDGTKVESVANRMVTFPANIKHHGTSCTDEKRRIVINFNYFENT